jgi:hypothetical protein
VRSTSVVEPPFALPSAIPSVVDAADAAEIAVAELLAEVLGVRRVPVDSHFFDDLGADSMVITRFCARLRRQPDLPNVQARDRSAGRGDRYREGHARVLALDAVPHVVRAAGEVRRAAGGRFICAPIRLDASSADELTGRLGSDHGGT